MSENQPLFDLYQQKNVFFSAHALSEDSLRNCSMVICTATPAECEQLRTLLTLPDLIKSGREDFHTPTQRYLPLVLTQRLFASSHPSVN